MPYTDFELERRMDRVVALLESHDDIYDSLSRQETSHSGFGDPVRRQRRCVCGGQGCGQCERSAVRAAELGVRLRRGFVLVEERDGYDTGVEGSFDPLSRNRRERAKLIDDAIERLRTMELVREGVYAERVDYEKMLDLADRRDSRGSYRELRATIGMMPVGLRGRSAVRWIADRMPDRIRIPRWAYERELDRVAGQVVQLRDDGFRVDEIKGMLGVSRRQVKNILRSASKSETSGMIRVSQ